MTIKYAIPLLFIIIIPFFIIPVNAQVINGGFDADTYLSSWSLTGRVEAHTVHISYPHSARFWTYTGSSYSTCSQNVDITGYQYLNFYMYGYADTDTMLIKVDGDTLLTVSDWNVSNWEPYTIDISGYTGTKQIQFAFWAGNTAWGYMCYLDNVGISNTPLVEPDEEDCSITWSPDPGEITNSTVWRDAIYNVNTTIWDGSTTGLLRSKFYTYQWINNEWGTRQLRTVRDCTTYPCIWHTYINIYLITEDDRTDTLDWATYFPVLGPTEKMKLEVTLEYWNGTEITNDIYIYDPEYTYTPPPPEIPTSIPTTEPTPTPTYTPFPTSTPTAIPTPDPTDEGITNYTINKSGMGIFYDSVNGTIENLNGSLNGVSDFFLIPTYGMTMYVNNVNTTFTNNTNQSIGHKTILSEMMIPFIYHFPLKMQLLISYYLTLLLILIILER